MNFIYNFASFADELEFSGSTNAKQSIGATANSPKNQPIGWNVDHSHPVGPPPAYPGLSSKTVSSVNSAPPAYSPSFSNPPAYSSNMPHQPAYNPSFSAQPAYNPSYSRQPAHSPTSYNSNGNQNGYHGTSSYQNTHAASPSYNNHHTYSGYPSYNAQPSYNNHGYGSTFGGQGLGGNTYISHNYYGGGQKSGNYQSGMGGFLTGALFSGSRRRSHHSRSWNRRDDRRWRSTSRSPYFENKVPGETRADSVFRF